MDSNNLVLYYDYARERLRSQEALNREYGAKAHNILALGAALMAVAAVIITTSAPVVYSNDFWITVGCLSFAFVRCVLRRWCSMAILMAIRTQRARRCCIQYPV